MRRAATWCWLAACGFSPGAATDAGRAIDAATDAKPIDAANDETCAVTFTGSGSDAGQVGDSTGGGNLMMLTCAAGAAVAGVTIDMSNGNVDNTSDRSARGIAIECAQFVIDAQGGHTGSLAPSVLADGNGGNNWAPSSLTTATCPQGAFVGGMMVYSGASNSLFENIALLCTLLDPTGKLASSTSVPVPDTDSVTQNSSSVSCPTGQGVVGMRADSGAGLDSVQLYCAPSSCE
jgi:hypothetical protein